MCKYNRDVTPPPQPTQKKQVRVLFLKKTTKYSSHPRSLRRALPRSLNESLSHRLDPWVPPLLWVWRWFLSASSTMATFSFAWPPTRTFREAHSTAPESSLLADGFCRYQHSLNVLHNASAWRRAVVNTLYCFSLDGRVSPGKLQRMVLRQVSCSGHVPVGIIKNVLVKGGLQLGKTQQTGVACQ